MKETSEENNRIEEIRETLLNHGVDITQWGKGCSKSLENLVDEVRDGEAELAVDHNGEISRISNIVKADILYNDAATGKKFKLVEDKQVFNDGRERERHIDTSIGEKMKPKESAQEALERGIEEELGISSLTDIKSKEDKIVERESKSYPGLLTKYIFHIFEATISQQDFKPEGYVEKGKNLTTYFVWQELKEI
ncbi:MAG: hypothetical protein Q7S53_02795 [bacterium]|nr:hypothetical protein [bacterium]